MNYIFSLLLFMFQQDATPPAVVLSSGSCGPPIQGIQTITAYATDNVGVVGVQFKVDGANLGSEILSGEYRQALDTRTLTNACHIVAATARDAAGNSATSTMAVRVVN